MDFKSLNLKVGLEIHQQLDSHKLFCNCSSEMKREAYSTIKRKQHPIQSELGQVDIASQFEYLRNRTFHYEIFPHETCLVELDEEPPHYINQEALQTALQVAILLNCEIPEEIHVMRKTVIDGSTPTSFQRTMMVGLNGFIKFKEKKIEIRYVSLEEDAASALKEEDGNVVYRLNRVGIPLVEISTGTLSNFSPQEIQEIAYQIGLIARSTRKVKRGIGTIRQDLNVSVKDGERVEIKGVQDLGILSKIIEMEVQRQLKLPKVKKEVRGALMDGTTKFLRPLPGAARMYPESDVLPIMVTQEMINDLKRSLPENLNVKLQRFKEKLKLSDILAKEILQSDYLGLFEKIISDMGISPTTVANAFVNTLVDLRRKNIPVDNLNDDNFIELFNLIKLRKLPKESISIILEELSRNPNKSLLNVIKEKNLFRISESDLVKLIRNKIKQNKSSLKDKNSAFNLLMGIVMKEVRGRADGEIVSKVLKEEINSLFR